MDTGSSDTWLAASNFECVSLYTYTPTDQLDCHFGEDLYYIDATWTEIPNENFNICEFAPGTPSGHPQGDTNSSLNN